MWRFCAISHRLRLLPYYCTYKWACGNK